MTTAGIVLRVACMLLAWLFVFRYARVGWTKTDEGRHLMGYTLITAIFMSLAAYVSIWGRYPWFDQVSMLLYGWLAYLLGRRNWLLTAAQRDRRAEAAAEQPT